MIEFIFPAKNMNRAIKISKFCRNGFNAICTMDEDLRQLANSLTPYSENLMIEIINETIETILDGGSASSTFNRRDKQFEVIFHGKATPKEVAEAVNECINLHNTTYFEI